MKRHTMFIDLKTQNSQDISSPPDSSIGLMQFLSKSLQGFCRHPRIQTS